MTTRTIKALEQLAKRPGTAHEGIVARGKLDAAKISHPHLFGFVRPSFANFAPVIRTWTCGCGRSGIYGHERCPNADRHEQMRRETEEKFKKGDRVYYNYWAYNLNTAATVIGMPRPIATNWDWIRLKFDHLKTARNVPIYSDKGCHLSREPLDRQTANHFSK